MKSKIQYNKYKLPLNQVKWPKNINFSLNSDEVFDEIGHIIFDLNLVKIHELCNSYRVYLSLNKSNDSNVKKNGYFEFI